MSTRDLVCVALALIGGRMRECGPEVPDAEPRARGDAGRDPGWDISVAPDGVGTPTRARDGCDGRDRLRAEVPGVPRREGRRAAERPAGRRAGDAGEQGTGAHDRELLAYATTVFDYVRRSMPYIQPQSLTNDEVYAVTAYLLSLNGIISENDEMNAQTLPKVKMPNQSNFIIVYPSRGK